VSVFAIQQQPLQTSLVLAHTQVHLSWLKHKEVASFNQAVQCLLYSIIDQNDS
jgi:hypothetical protein